MKKPTLIHWSWIDQTNNQINQMQRKVLCLFYIVNCFILTRICSKSKSMARSQFDPRLCAALVQSKSLGRPPPHWPCDVNKVKTQNMRNEKVKTLALVWSQNVSIYDSPEMFPTCQGTACFSPESPPSCKGLQSTCENAVLAIITITGQNGVHLVHEISPWSSQVLGIGLAQNLKPILSDDKFWNIDPNISAFGMWLICDNT